jgi:MerR HTH family regulatory protein
MEAIIVNPFSFRQGFLLASWLYSIYNPFDKKTDYLLKESPLMELLTTSKVALMLGMTSDNVRYHERLGHLLALRVQRANGEYMRLFVREDVERFQRQREALEQAKPLKAAVS